MTLDDSKTSCLKIQEISHLNIQYASISDIQYASISDIQYASITDISLEFSILVFINHTNLKLLQFIKFCIARNYLGRDYSCNIKST